MKTDCFQKQLPDPRDFRVWVQGALTSLSIPPASLSRAIGASVNFLGAFLSDDGRDISLSRAARVELHLRGVASERGVDLPEMIPDEGGDFGA